MGNVNFSFACFDVDNVEMKKLDCLKRGPGEERVRPGEERVRPGEEGVRPGEERVRPGEERAGEDGGAQGCERPKEENARESEIYYVGKPCELNLRIENASFCSLEH